MHSLPDAVKELIRRNKRPLITWFEIESFVAASTANAPSMASAC